MVVKKSGGMSKSNASLRGSSCRSNAMRRATSACRRRMRARVQNRFRRGFPVWCCGMSSAGGCQGASLAAASKTEPASQGPSFGAHVLPALMNSLYRSSDLAKSSPVPTVSTRCSAKPGRIEPSSSVRCPKRGTVSSILPTTKAVLRDAVRRRRALHPGLGHAVPQRVHVAQVPLCPHRVALRVVCGE